MDVDRESLRKAALGFGAVSELTAYTVIAYFVGGYLDSMAHTGSWLTVLLTLLGLIFGFYRLLAVMKASEKK